MTQRMGRVIGIDPSAIARYKALHANIWPQVADQLAQSNIRNFSIFLREPENLLFSYWEYTGTNFEADRAKSAEDPVTKDWWDVCGPLQRPLESRAEGEWWASMELIFHAD